MRPIAITTLAVLLLAALPALADFRTIDEAHEVPFQYLVLPSSDFGTLRFRKCASCELISLQTTPETAYSLNGETYTLRAFGVELQRIRSTAIAAENVVTVVERLATGTILSVTVRQ